MNSLIQSDRGPNLLLGTGVEIGDGVEVGANVIVHDDVVIGDGVQLDHGVVIGRMARMSRGSNRPPPRRAPTTVGAESVICAYAIVEAGVELGMHSLIGDHAAIREGAKLGADVAVGLASQVKHGAEIHDRVRMQSHCVVGSGVVIEEDAFLGPGVHVLTGRMMTSEARRPPPHLQRGCQIGAGARIMPGVDIGAEAIVGAGAVVTGDIPAGTVVRGVPAR